MLRGGQEAAFPLKKALKIHRKILGAFIIVIAVAVVVLSLTSRFYINSIFDRYADSFRGVVEEQWEYYLRSYYLNRGSWDGVENILVTRPGRRGGGIPPGMEREGYRGVLPGEGLLLADAAGTVLLDTQNERTGEKLPQNMLERGNTIVVNGEKVGTLLLLPSASRAVLTMEEHFSRSVLLAVFWGALGALAVGAFISVFLTRQIVKPLELLTTSARKFAGRDFQHRVKLGKKDEIGKLADAFNFMAESIEKNEKVRSNLLADVSHELRTPLTILRGNFEALQAGKIEATPELFSSLYDEVLRLGRLISDLEKLNLAEAGKLPLNLQLVNIDTLFSKVTPPFRHEATERDIRFYTKTEGVKRSWLLDEDRIIQVLINLLANAFKYTPDQGEIRLAAREVGENLEITVHDSGPGIPEDEIPYIFDRFYKTGTGRGDGCGLGLSITKSFVEAHGGSVSVYNVPDGGSEFLLSLPFITQQLIQRL